MSIQKNPLFHLFYEFLGRRIKTLQNQKMTAGTFNVSWDGRDDNGKEVVSGIYFYSFKPIRMTAYRILLVQKR